MSAGTGPARPALSFRRIVDIPFQTCVAALENWQCAGPHGELHIGQSLLRGPLRHDCDSGTYCIEVRLARGPLRPLLPMRLSIDRWSGPAARTALELIPGTRVRPAAAYFRAGHLLLDALTRRLSNLNDQQRDERQATEEENLPRSSHLADGHVDDTVNVGSPLVSAVIFPQIKIRSNTHEC